MSSKVIRALRQHCKSFKKNIKIKNKYLWQQAKSPNSSYYVLVYFDIISLTDNLPDLFVKAFANKAGRFHDIGELPAPPGTLPGRCPAHHTCNNYQPLAQKQANKEFLILVYC